MIDKFRLFILKFINSNKETPFIAALAAGVYPMLYYFASNFGHVNSWDHVLYFLGVCIAIPYIIILVLRYIFSKIKYLRNYARYVIPIVNILWFTLLMAQSSSNLSVISGLVILIGAIFLGVLLVKHIKKLIVFQLFLALISLFYLSPKVYAAASESKEWLNQPDDITSVKFETSPNIYLIQPDGYANFSELKKGHYNIDNSEFENFLVQNGFTLYDDYRSNYFSTISSNSSLFSMKHHYYNDLKFKTVESYNARNVIAGNNPVIDIFKNNGYKTTLLLESEYLIVNRPSVNYDYQNITFDDMPYMTEGFDIERDLVNDLKTTFNHNSESKKFYFIEKIIPSHIAQSRYNNLGKVQERLEYIERLHEANIWLKEMITTIKKEDTNGIIIIMADHGGFVGMNSIYEAKIKQNDPDLVRSVFSSALAIKWPNSQAPEGLQFKSSVNFFRNLFTYLSNNQSYLKHLEEDASYLAIKKEAPFGVYKAIDKDNNVIFEKLTD